MERVSRRDFFTTSFRAGVFLLLAACGRLPERPSLTPTVAIRSIGNGPNQGPYDLTEANGVLTDGRIDFLQHPFLEAVKFSFDPARQGGSLVLDTILRKDAEFRLISDERDQVLSTNPGIIFCAPTLEKAGPVRKFPVIRFGPREEYLISLGFKLPGEDCLTTYKEMHTYYITRDGSGNLQGRFEGLRTFNPNDPSFKPRDSEAAQPAYFQKGCLS
ncbi:hypothetical protein HY384_03980 [Candidatus Daviesbacteria bacterium]|nr:hypothetical protein [Candidatus Daviesbacteria bacterium]